MAFSLPTFNVNVNIWRNGNAHTNPPDVTAFGNLSPGRLVGEAQPEGVGVLVGTGASWLRLPKGTDIRDAKAPAGEDTCEVAAASGRIYRVAWVDDIGGGFANEHRFAVIQGVGPWPVPFPSVTGHPPPPSVTGWTFRGSGSNHFPGTNTTVVNVNTGTDTLVCVVVFTADPTIGPTVNGNAAIGGSVATLTGSGHTAKVGTYIFAVAPGPVTITAQLGFGQTHMMQVHVLSGGNYTPASNPVAAANGVGGDPAVNAGVGGPVARMSYSVGVGEIAPVGASAPVAPYTLISGMLSDTLAGILFRSAVYDDEPVALGNYPFVQHYPGVNTGAWGCSMVGES